MLTDYLHVEISWLWYLLKTTINYKRNTYPGFLAFFNLPQVTCSAMLFNTSSSAFSRIYFHKILSFFLKLSTLSPSLLPTNTINSSLFTKANKQNIITLSSPAASCNAKYLEKATLSYFAFIISLLPYDLLMSQLPLMSQRSSAIVNSLLSLGTWWFNHNGSFLKLCFLLTITMWSCSWSLDHFESSPLTPLTPV